MPKLRAKLLPVKRHIDGACAKMIGEREERDPWQTTVR
jgi:hypothetical protein